MGVGVNLGWISSSIAVGLVVAANRAHNDAHPLFMFLNIEHLMMGDPQVQPIHAGFKTI